MEEDLALPGVDDPLSGGQVMGDTAFDAMLEDFDQDALEAEKKPAEVDDQPLQKEDAQEDDPLVQTEGTRKDLKLEAGSLRHLLTHLPKNPHCLSCQQAKMKQKYSHRGALKREMAQFGEIVTCDHVVSCPRQCECRAWEVKGTGCQCATYTPA